MGPYFLPPHFFIPSPRPDPRASTRHLTLHDQKPLASLSSVFVCLHCPQRRASGTMTGPEEGVLERARGSCGLAPVTRRGTVPPACPLI